MGSLSNILGGKTHYRVLIATLYVCHTAEGTNVGGSTFNPNESQFTLRSVGATHKNSFHKTTFQNPVALCVVGLY